MDNHRFKNTRVKKVFKRKIASHILTKNVDKCRKNFLYKLGCNYLIDRKFPLLIYLELTRNCNYNCPMCSRTENSLEGYMDLGLVEKIVNEVGEYGPTVFCLHLFGEPLLHPQFIEICDIIKRKKGNKIILTTNGSLLTEDKIPHINAYVDKIYVSIHSLDFPTYHKLTGKKGILSTVLDNISNFCKMGDKKKITMRLFETPKFSKEDMRKFKATGVNYEVKKYHNYAGERKEWSGIKSMDRYPCYHLWFTLAVAVNGDILPCCADVRHRLKLGNANQDKLTDVWKTGLLKTIRFMHCYETVSGICEECDQWQYRPDMFFKICPPEAVNSLVK